MRRDEADLEPFKLIGPDSQQEKARWSDKCATMINRPKPIAPVPGAVVAEGSPTTVLVSEACGHSRADHMLSGQTMHALHAVTNCNHDECECPRWS